MRDFVEKKLKGAKCGELYLAAAVLILSIMYVVVLSTKMLDEYYSPVSIGESYVAGTQELRTGDVVEQSFLLEVPTKGVFLRFVTYAEEPEGSALVSVERGGELLAQWPLDLSTVNDVMIPTTFYMPEGEYLTESLEKPTVLRIEFLDIPEGVRLSMGMSEPLGEVEEGEELYLNSSELNAQLGFGILQTATINFIPAVSVLLGLGGAGLLAAVWLVREKKIGITAATALVLAAVIVPLSFVLPLGYGFDIEFHYDTAYQLSNTMLGKSDWNLQSDSETEGRSYLGRACDDISESLCFYTDDIIDSYLKTSEGVFDFADEEDCVPTIKDEASRGEPFYIYLPMAAGFSLARIVGLGNIGLLLLGRLFNYVTYAVLACLAIWLIPKYKELLMITVLSPASMILSATLSRDGIIEGMILVFIALCLRLRFSFRPAVLITAAVILGLLSPCKIVYVPLGLLMIWSVLPYAKQMTKGQYALLGVGILLAAGLFFFFGWSSVYNTATEEVSTAIRSVVPGYRVSDIIHSPIRFLSIAINTVLHQAGDWVRNAFAVYEIQLGLSESMFMAPLAAMSIAVIGFSKHKKEVQDNKPLDFKTMDKIFFGVVILAVAALTIVAAFQWTASNRFEIDGIQGRYFTPLLPLAAFLFIGQKRVLLRNVPRNLPFYIMAVVNYLMVINMFIWALE